MKLDKFDQVVWDKLEEGSNALDFIQETYPHTNISSISTAVKRKTAIRMHLEHKQNLPEDDANGNDNKYYREKIKWNSEDGSKVIDKAFELTLNEYDNQTPQLILEKLGLDALQWKLVSYEIYYGSWTTTIKNNQGDGIPCANYTCRCKAKVIPVQQFVTSDYVKQIFYDLLPPKIESIEYIQGEYLVELPIMDVHLGKLSLEDESGIENNLELAIKLYKRTVLDILSSIKNRRISVDKFFFPFGNDYFHIDNVNNSTTSGTLVDTDGKWHLIYDAGIDALIWTLEQLRQIALVDVIYIPGNHDETLGYCAINTAKKYYENVTDINIDASKSPRKWMNYGISTVLFTHLRYETSRILDIIRNELPKDILVNSLFIEVHGADKHHEEVKDHGGIIVRRVPSITTIDKWHNDRGYKAIRRAQAFIWHKQLGMTDIIQSNVII